MHILVLNAGSSSLKYQVLDMTDQSVVIKGIVEKIGLSDSFLEYEIDGKKTHIYQKINNHKDALKLVIDKSLRSKISNLSSLSAIGHRVVHGGEYFQNAVLIDDDVLAKIKACNELAPLHNPANAAGIIACKALFPGILQVAVFDTAFHQSMEPAHYLYAIPYKYYEKYKIRRYGFHGTSHQFVYDKLVTSNELRVMGKKPQKVITCHVGNGVSITAIKDGKVIETSMGMTPMEGVMMGTRCGNIDPGVLTFLMKKEGLSPEQLEDMLNQESGLLGVSGVSSDIRDILAGCKIQDARCILALEMYINSIAKYIGAYAALLGGVGAIVLTGGVMEHRAIVRMMLIEKLAWMGITLDKQANQDEISAEKLISTPDSLVKVVVIPTDEELMIAKEVLKEGMINNV
ncbi:MAG: acetate kinase [Candidatus Absconditabacterales bacterium]